MVSAPPRLRLPSLEYVIEPLIAYLTDNLQDALDDVEADAELRSYPAITLSMPAVYLRAANGLHSLPSEWPALVVETFPLKRTPPAIGITGQRVAENKGAGQWRGTFWLQYWIQNDDADLLARSLYRYESALWRCLTEVDDRETFGPGTLDPSSMAMGSAQIQGVATGRAAVVEFDVTLTA